MGGTEFNPSMEMQITVKCIYEKSHLFAHLNALATAFPLCIKQKRKKRMAAMSMYTVVSQMKMITI